MTQPDLTVAAKEHLSQVLASTTAPYLAFAVNQEDPEMVADLLTPLGRQELMALAVVLASQVMQPRTRPDDGIVDEVAVTRAAMGEPLPLTRDERREAILLMHGRGVPIYQIAQTLHVSWATASRVVDGEAAENRRRLLEALDDDYEVAS